MIDPSEHIMFAGRDWQVLKSWLLSQKENKIGMLTSPSTTHDVSNQLRGSLIMIQAILALESAANGRKGN